MQPHLADGSRTSTSAIRIAERRIGERRWSNEFVVTRYVVVLNLGPVYRAELINESEGGIAIQVGELHRTTAVGRSIDVIYRAVQRMTNESYRTDFGYSLEGFAGDYMDLVDNRTTVLVIGDGCNNGFDPRLDIFETITRRSRRTIWIVTEMHAWTQYDSDMAKYAPLCDNVLTAYT
ncbi:MAG TPA: hypothetical protein P5307_14020, partial [Pirellulaceae bacterium]|nr:hypothetical protein [Pirellulaceae bacterium]